ncbi:MAG: uncharacterized protein G01um101418_339 [Parcubacteria group bacterium Gr01-1014_18]|nr:MAG: uncharacterized protein Greene041636_285 [Parcubacteria group bacterium Greene0416_36]TSC81199.1 MAG: uncharacterized protein G01um101418_339 [Parcubacteria group bacterium Gr01-1014_18]TSC99196.1 MAG: uncharacterized protein Greene101420_341 [Parcubacteria group bacterium Greene1014_20]TSD07446.1 MAG: uncharacterized protein Greene07142_145 [Parcubacteria group bacterium Greene0714_2]
MLILLYFVIFGILGWFLDMLYRSLVIQKWNSGTHIPGFSVIHAMGALWLYFFIPFISDFSLIGRFLLYAGTLTLVEFLGALFSIYVMKKRFWNYSNNFLNFRGHIDFVHTFYWGILALIFEQIIYPLL